MKTKMAGCWSALFVGILVSTSPHDARAEESYGCALDENGVVVGFDAEGYDDEDEANQYLNLLNFYSLSFFASPLQAPAVGSGLDTEAGIALAYLPQLSCLERAVFYGTKIEDTNKTPIFPRLHLGAAYSLPGAPIPVSLSLGLHGVPPVPLFGVTSLVLGTELTLATQLKSGLAFGLRGHYVFGKVTGAIAGQYPGSEAPEVDDEFRTHLRAVELLGAYHFTSSGVRYAPYVALGYTSVNAWMYVGETRPGGFDGSDPSDATVPDEGNRAGLYNGPSLELGLQALLGSIKLVAEVYGAPMNLVTPSSRFYFSPRVRLAYAFF